MSVIAGVDIGNSTTEVCLAVAHDDGGLTFLSSACGATTGVKGTPENIAGIRQVLAEALGKAAMDMAMLDVIRLNEAAPVIGDTAMETIRATVITDSAMIGHDPDTPAGAGCAVGRLVRIENIAGLPRGAEGESLIAVIPSGYGYGDAASIINRYAEHWEITGLILQGNEAVLVWNRLNKKIPVLDEVAGIDRIPEGRLAAIEVALPGETVKVLSNPYGIAALFKLSAEDTKRIALIARSLIGSRSGAVIKSPGAKITSEAKKAGTITFIGTKQVTIDVDAGAEAIMECRTAAGELADVRGEDNTNIGSMLGGIRSRMAGLTGEDADDIHITDFFAADTFVPMTIDGGLAGETCPEKAVAVASMVKTKRLPMNKIAQGLLSETGVNTRIGGVEAVMAALGALTTPGTELPLAVLDLGGGSVDAAVIDERGVVRSTHFAGAGELVTLIIAAELAIERPLAELIKIHPMARAESLFNLRLESGNVIFLEKPLPPVFFGHNVLLASGEYINTGIRAPLERAVDIRRAAKSKVFIKNALRALTDIAPSGKLSGIASVALVGGSALDFEIPDMIAGMLSSYSIVCGRADVLGKEGPRGAVATGLVMCQ